MPRANRICSAEGCLSTRGLKNGRCAKHPFQRYEKPWERSNPYQGVVSALVKNTVKYFAGGICARCGGEGSEVDHIIPSHLGGSDEMGNLQYLCSACHKDKTSKEATAARIAARDRRSNNVPEV